MSPSIRRKRRSTRWRGCAKTPRSPRADHSNSPALVGDAEAHVRRLRLDPELLEDPGEVRVVAVVHDDEAGVDRDAGAVAERDRVGVGVAAGVRARLEHGHLVPGPVQLGCRGQPGDAGPDDDDPARARAIPVVVRCGAGRSHGCPLLRARDPIGSIRGYAGSGRRPRPGGGERMRQLTSLDAQFLAIESSTHYGHVGRPRRPRPLDARVGRAADRGRHRADRRAHPPAAGDAVEAGRGAARARPALLGRGHRASTSSTTCARSRCPPPATTAASPSR